MAVKLTQAHQKMLLVDAARLSRMAYSSPDKVYEMYRQVKAGKAISDTETAQVLQRVVEVPVHFNDPKTDAQGYGIKYDSPSGRMTILAYRGTSSLADAFADSEIRLVPLKTVKLARQKGCCVHGGFLSQFIALESQTDAFLHGIYENMQDSISVPKEVVGPSDPPAIGGNSFTDMVTDNIKNASKLFVGDASQIYDEDKIIAYESFLAGPPLLFVGHSLGSSDSCIGALVYSLRFNSNGVAWSGFGCPRTGNEGWANLFNSHIKIGVRVKNARDPIATVPPKILYREVGNEYIHVGKFDPMPDISFLTDISDHDIAKYVAHLQQDNTAENPLEMLTYLAGFVMNIPVKVWNFIRSLK